MVKPSDGGDCTTFEVMTSAYERVVHRYMGPGPESQEGPCESLKSPIALTIDLIFSTTFSIFR
jgi:hypothetical protein